MRQKEYYAPIPVPSNARMRSTVNGAPPLPGDDYLHGAAGAQRSSVTGMKRLPVPVCTRTQLCREALAYRPADLLDFADDLSQRSHKMNAGIEENAACALRRF